jgi:hypothetical protein
MPSSKGSKNTSDFLKYWGELALVEGLDAGGEGPLEPSEL